ncbi:MAG: hypothetical protein HYU41_08610 [Candidatus Rokubacteria bacterium]|nr:hypothetical protein [Candidatus Rokubacteria bacterium]
MPRQTSLPGVPAPVGPTRIYRVHGVSRDLRRAARARAVRDGTTLRAVFVQALTEYAAGGWTPRPDAGARSTSA